MLGSFEAINKHDTTIRVQHGDSRCGKVDCRFGMILWSIAAAKKQFHEM